ncbi:MAG: SRPBCC family protein [Aquihabitans sp.]
MGPFSHPSSDDRASIHIDAPPDVVYALVTDVARMGRFSPECTGGRWLDGATGPAVGARFKGTNRRGVARWSTTNEVVEAETDRAFAFETKQSGMRWRYDLEPDGEGTLLTESREAWRSQPLVAKIFTAVVLGGTKSHDDELREGMTATLEKIKRTAEEGA